MTRFFSSRILLTGAGLFALGVGGVVIAQSGGGGGVAAFDDAGNFEVDGVAVDVVGKTSDDARHAGWKLAQRKAWAMLTKRLGTGGPVSDATLDNMVSGIVVEREDIGPNRYIARLGVLFDRGRAGSLLGVAGGGERSPPMLTVPIEWTGGTGIAFEQKTDWQEAWARFRAGNSTIDYIRPTGTGPDSLLLNTGQVDRPGRGWWRVILDQYGASDVLIPVVRLSQRYPGGPVIGTFEARYGPDNVLLRRFALRVNSADGLPALLDAGVQRIDQAYQQALSAGVLRADPGLSYTPPAPEVAATDEMPGEGEQPVTIGSSLPNVPSVTAISVQFDTPGAAAVANTEAAMRGVPGVSAATTTSLALGGMSVMRVSFAGDPAAFADALRARGWVVQGSGGTVRIRRPSLPPPDVPNDTGTTG